MLFVIIVVFIIFVLIAAAISARLEAGQESNTVLPYRQKRYFFSRSELEFYKILNSHLDAHKYTIFTKVRLADFMEVQPASRSEYKWLNKITRKHVDFLIWDLVESQIVLAVELDGKSHNGSAAAKSDNFKNELYKTVGLRLVRVKAGSNFEEESKKIVETI